MILVTLRIQAPVARRTEMFKSLSALVQPTQVEPGCLSCHLYQDTDDTNVLVLWEEWEDHDSLERHLRSEEYRRVLTIMDMAASPPDIQFHMIADTTGIETIHDVRGSV